MKFRNHIELDKSTAMFAVVDKYGVVCGCSDNGQYRLCYSRAEAQEWCVEPGQEVRPVIVTIATK